MVRCYALLSLLLCLAACGDRQTRAPFTDSRPPPGLSPRDWPPRGWAWGLIQAGAAPAQRYGVVAAPTVPRAQALILPGYGDFAESHFAEATALTERGDTVWILDGVGQGGSGRAVFAGDIGHVASFETDERGLETMVRDVARPSGERPFILVAEGEAAPVALRALQLGRVSASGLVLIDPVLRAPGRPDLDRAHWVSRAGLGMIRAPGGAGWTRNDAVADPDRRRRMAWQIANPDLRMGDPSFGWQAAFDDLTQTIRAAGWARVTLPVLLLTIGPDRADQDRLCRALPHCARQRLDAAHSRMDVEAASIQSLMGPNALPPWSRPTESEDEPQSVVFDTPR
jgi:lysophospholipase